MYSSVFCCNMKYVVLCVLLHNIVIYVNPEHSTSRRLLNKIAIPNLEPKKDYKILTLTKNKKPRFPMLFQANKKQEANTIVQNENYKEINNGYDNKNNSDNNNYPYQPFYNINNTSDYQDVNDSKNFYYFSITDRNNYPYEARNTTAETLIENYSKEYSKDQKHKYVVTTENNDINRNAYYDNNDTENRTVHIDNLKSKLDLSDEGNESDSALSRNKKPSVNKDFSYLYDNAYSQETILNPSLQNNEEEDKQYQKPDEILFNTTQFSNDTKSDLVNYLETVTIPVNLDTTMNNVSTGHESYLEYDVENTTNESSFESKASPQYIPINRSDSQESILNHLLQNNKDQHKQDKTHANTTQYSIDTEGNSANYSKTVPIVVNISTTSDKEYQQYGSYSHDVGISESETAKESPINLQYSLENQNDSVQNYFPLLNKSEHSQEIIINSTLQNNRDYGSYFEHDYGRYESQSDLEQTTSLQYSLENQNEIINVSGFKINNDSLVKLTKKFSDDGSLKRMENTSIGHVRDEKNEYLLTESDNSNKRNRKDITDSKLHTQKNIISKKGNIKNHLRTKEIDKSDSEISLSERNSFVNNYQAQTEMINASRRSFSGLEPLQDIKIQLKRHTLGNYNDYSDKSESSEEDFNGQSQDFMPDYDDKLVVLPLDYTKFQREEYLNNVLLNNIPYNNKRSQNSKEIMEYYSGVNMNKHTTETDDLDKVINEGDSNRIVKKYKSKNIKNVDIYYDYPSDVQNNGKNNNSQVSLKLNDKNYSVESKYDNPVTYSNHNLRNFNIFLNSVGSKKAFRSPNNIKNKINTIVNTSYVNYSNNTISKNRKQKPKPSCNKKDHIRQITKKRNELTNSFNYDDYIDKQGTTVKTFYTSTEKSVTNLKSVVYTNEEISTDKPVKVPINAEFTDKYNTGVEAIKMSTKDMSSIDEEIIMADPNKTIMHDGYTGEKFDTDKHIKQFISDKNTSEENTALEINKKLIDDEHVDEEFNMDRPIDNLMNDWLKNEEVSVENIVNKLIDDGHKSEEDIVVIPIKTTMFDISREMSKEKLIKNQTDVVHTSGEVSEKVPFEKNMYNKYLDRELSAEKTINKRIDNKHTEKVSTDKPIKDLMNVKYTQDYVNPVIPINIPINDGYTSAEVNQNTEKNIKKPIADKNSSKEVSVVRYNEKLEDDKHTSKELAKNKLIEIFMNDWLTNKESSTEKPFNKQIDYEHSSEEDIAIIPDETLMLDNYSDKELNTEKFISEQIDDEYADRKIGAKAPVKYIDYSDKEVTIEKLLNKRFDGKHTEEVSTYIPVKGFKNVQHTDQNVNTVIPIKMPINNGYTSAEVSISDPNKITINGGFTGKKVNTEKGIKNTLTDKNLGKVVRVVKQNKKLIDDKPTREESSVDEPIEKFINDKFINKELSREKLYKYISEEDITTIPIKTLMFDKYTGKEKRTVKKINDEITGGKVGAKLPFETVMYNNITDKEVSIEKPINKKIDSSHMEEYSTDKPIKGLRDVENTGEIVNRVKPVKTLINEEYTSTKASIPKYDNIIMNDVYTDEKLNTKEHMKNHITNKNSSKEVRLDKHQTYQIDDKYPEGKLNKIKSIESIINNWNTDKEPSKEKSFYNQIDNDNPEEISSHKPIKDLIDVENTGENVDTVIPTKMSVNGEYPSAEVSILKPNKIITNDGYAREKALHVKKLISDRTTDEEVSAVKLYKKLIDDEDHLSEEVSIDRPIEKVKTDINKDESAEKPFNKRIDDEHINEEDIAVIPFKTLIFDSDRETSTKHFTNEPIYDKQTSGEINAEVSFEPVMNNYYPDTEETTDKPLFKENYKKHTDEVSTNKQHKNLRNVENIAIPFKVPIDNAHSSVEVSILEPNTINLNDGYTGKKVNIKKHIKKRTSKQNIGKKVSKVKLNKNLIDDVYTGENFGIDRPIIDWLTNQEEKLFKKQSDHDHTNEDIAVIPIKTLMYDTGTEISTERVEKKQISDEHKIKKGYTSSEVKENTGKDMKELIANKNSSNEVSVVKLNEKQVDHKHLSTELSKEPIENFMNDWLTNEKMNAEIPSNKQIEDKHSNEEDIAIIPINTLLLEKYSGKEIDTENFNSKQINNEHTSREVGPEVPFETVTYYYYPNKEVRMEKYLNKRIDYKDTAHKQELSTDEPIKDLMDVEHTGKYLDTVKLIKVPLSDALTSKEVSISEPDETIIAVGNTSEKVNLENPVKKHINDNISQEVSLVKFNNTLMTIDDEHSSKRINIPLETFKNNWHTDEEVYTEKSFDKLIDVENNSENLSTDKLIKHVMDAENTGEYANPVIPIKMLTKDRHINQEISFAEESNEISVNNGYLGEKVSTVKPVKNVIDDKNTGEVSKEISIEKFLNDMYTSKEMSRETSFNGEKDDKHVGKKVNRIPITTFTYNRFTDKKESAEQLIKKQTYDKHIGEGISAEVPKKTLLFDKHKQKDVGRGRAINKHKNDGYTGEEVSLLVINLKAKKPAYY